MDTTHHKVDMKLLSERQAGIRRLTAEARNMRLHQIRGIWAARASGSSWADIAQALGMSRQAAQKLAAQQLPDDDPAGAARLTD